MKQITRGIAATIGLALMVGCASETRQPPRNAEIELEQALRTARSAGKSVLLHVSGPG